MNTAELFLFSPFPGDERTTLTGTEISVDEFYNKIYSKPWLLSHPEDVIASEDQENLENLIEFEEKLFGVHSTPRPFYIIGYSGSGKSIYLGHLLNHIKKRDVIIKLDFAKFGTGLNQVVTLFGRDWINQFSPANTLTYFVTLLVKQVDDMLSVVNISDEKLKRIERFYNDVLVKKYYYEYIDLFKEILDYKRGKDADKYSANMYRLISKRLNERETAIAQLLRIVYLISYAEYYSTKKRIFVAIDSLEHFIRGTNDKTVEIYNSDISQICVIMSDSLSNFAHMPIFENEQEIYDKIRTLISCRDTSRKMMPVDEEDAHIYYVNVSLLFRASDILENRLKYYSDNLSKKKFVLEDEDTVCRALKDIFEDEINERGLYDKLHTMYNSNYRRMIIHLVKALKTNNMYDDYLFLVKKINEESDYSYIYRRGARQLVVASLLRDIASTSFFTRILTTVPKNKGMLGLSVARKILTYLCRRVPEDKADDAECYVSLYDLIEGAFKKANGTKISNKEIETIAEVLISLNESDVRLNHWCQLVVIKYNEEQFKISDLGGKLKYFRDNPPSSAEKNYAVKITNAGRFMLAQMSEFEYFSARYTNGRPLFCKENLLKEGGKYKCIKIIEAVRKKTFDESHENKLEQTACLDVIWDDDMKFFSEDQGGRIWANMHSSEMRDKFYLYQSYKSNREYPHAERTLEQHISYLDYYRNYVLTLSKEDLNAESDELANQVKSEISEAIVNTIEKYVIKLQEFYSLQDGEGWFYCGGQRQNPDDRHYDTSTYLSQIASARENLLKIVHITRNN